VYYDRIEPTIQVWPGLASALLSNVFAHEIAHVLQSLNRHSDTGILKAHWARDDFLMMLTHRLSFTPLDVGLIRSGIADACGNFGSTD
jgi:predicted Zn-dependent protease